MNHKAFHPLKYSVHTRLREFHLKRLIQKISSGSLLDVGCGLGYLTYALGNSFKRVGLDYNILKANDYSKFFNMVRGEAIKLPFKEQCFDIIICSEVLEHLPDGMDTKALKEMSCLLKYGGRLLVTVPSLEGIRAESSLRNLGHENPGGGEYHHRLGYAWKDMKAIIDSIPQVKIIKKRYAMFLFSEIFTDLLKLVYLRKNNLNEHTDIMEMKDTFLFRVYRYFFPLLYFFFICEDMLIATFLKGHILVLALERVNGDKKAPKMPKVNKAN